MRTKITLLLLLLNVVLFFFIFGFERKWRTEALAEEARSRVLGPEAANLQSLTIEGKSLDTPIRLTRDGDAWNLTSPYEWPANPHAVSRILNELQFLEAETSFAVANLSATDLSLEHYGLASPTLTVQIESGVGINATTTSLAIGDRTEIGQRLYVLSPDGTRVHVVPDSLANSLSLDLAQLRANSCFTIPVFEVRSLNLQNDGPANVRVRLRREGNRWMFESPIVARAAKTATEVVLSDITSLRTASFLGAPSRQPDLIETAGLSSPTLRITLEGNNRRETLLLGNEISDTSANGADAAAGPALREFYARMEGRDAIFTVILPQRLAGDLRNAQSELRDRAVLDLSGRSIDAITLSDDDGHEVTLQKLESIAPAPASVTPASSWQVVQRRDDGNLRTQPADTKVVEEALIERLGALRALTFERDVPTDAELEAWGLARPTRTVTLSFKSELGTPTAPAATTLLLGTDQSGERVFAKLQRETFVYGIDPAILDQTTVDPLHYRQRLLRELPTGARITGLRLRDLTTDQDLINQQRAAEETWDDVIAAIDPARREALTQLLHQLRTLRAQRLVEDGFRETVRVNGQNQPWRFRLDVNLSVSGDEGEQAQSFSLFLADRDGGDRQRVGSPDLELIFEAVPALIDAVWTLSYAQRDPGPIELTPPPPVEGSAE